MQQQNRRHERVCELIKRAAGEIIRKNFPVQEVGIISVTGVEMSSDLRSATIYLSVLGNTEKQNRVLRLIRDTSKLIQSAIAKAVILKYMPIIRIELDHSIDRGNRVLEILKSLEKEGSIPPES